MAVLGGDVPMEEGAGYGGPAGPLSGEGRDVQRLRPQVVVHRLDRWPGADPPDGRLAAHGDGSLPAGPLPRADRAGGDPRGGGGGAPGQSEAPGGVRGRAAPLLPPRAARGDGASRRAHGVSLALMLAAALLGAAPAKPAFE